MSSLYRFDRRLLSRPCDTRAYKILWLCIQRKSVRIPSMHQYVPRRLAPQKPVEGPHRAAARSDALLGQQIGLSRKQREVITCANAPSGFPGANPRPPLYGGVPKRKEGIEHIPLKGRITHLASPAGQNLA